MDGSGRAHELLFSAVDAVFQPEGGAADAGDPDPDLQAVSDFEGRLIIRFGVGDDEDKALFVEDAAEAVALFFHELFERIVDKAKLAREIEDPGHVGVMHPDPVFMSKFHDA